ncbi:MAG: hypothetical protein ACRDM1_13420 [Gaiellaceae bacterium]
MRRLDGRQKSAAVVATSRTCSTCIAATRSDSSRRAPSGATPPFRRPLGIGHQADRGRMRNDLLGERDRVLEAERLEDPLAQHL